ncbi:hypothetical protein B0H10DRAFT_659694 [Mycena sp. CBHHK59/15]|nr:hypothetical protein B0H10DRAFT_659694 [Mycena sp. CBHHK59/15]
MLLLSEHLEIDPIHYAQGYQFASFSTSERLSSKFNAGLFTVLSFTVCAADAASRGLNAQRLSQAVYHHWQLSVENLALNGSPRRDSTPFRCASKQTFCCTNFEGARARPLRAFFAASVSAPPAAVNNSVPTIPLLLGTHAPARCCGNTMGNGVGIDCAPFTVTSSSSHTSSSRTTSAASVASSSHFSSLQPAPSSSSRPASSASSHPAGSSHRRPQVPAPLV